MTSPARKVALWAAFTVLVLGLPLLGVTLAGKPVSPYLVFPPRPVSAGLSSFSWPLFLILAAVEFGGACLFLRWLAKAPSRSERKTVAPLPWWGWLAGAWVLVAWALMWTRQDWSPAVLAQKFTFLWLGYVLLVNAWTWRRSGFCLLVCRPRYLALLFAGSALVWWYFEYLNQFVLNWSYPGTESLPPVSYFLQATLPFSTVLPAVVSTTHLLGTFPPLAAGRRGFSMAVRPVRRAAAGALVLGSLGLVGIGVWPNQSFPLIWLSPFLIFVSLQVFFGDETCLGPVASGYWGRPVGFALAALVCGTFWELWNFYSFPKWIYSIPFVHGFEIFEMPVLGYAGYLFFGIECWVFADFLDRQSSKAPWCDARADSDKRAQGDG